MYTPKKHPLFTRKLLIWLVSMVCTGHAWGNSPGQAALDKGVALYQRADFQAAAQAFLEATQADPALLKAWENLGWAYHKLHRDGEALRVWNTLLKIEPRYSEILNEIAAMAAQRADWDDAVANYEKSLRLNPEQPHIHLLAGDAYQKRHDVQSALEHYLRAAQSPEQEALAYRRIVAMYESTGDNKEAIKFLEGLSDKTTSSAELAQQLARLYALEGDLAFKKSDYALAESDYLKALQQSDNIRYRVNLGWAYRKQNANLQAIGAWKQALDRDPHVDDLDPAIADAYRDAGDMKAAQTWYEMAYAKTNAASVAFQLADMALHDGNIDLALHWLNTLYPAGSADPSWPVKIADLFIKHHQADRGIAFFTEHLAREKTAGTKPALSALYASVAKTAYRSDQYADAAAGYQQALNYNPMNADAMRDLGWAFWRMQRWKDCEVVWRNFAAVYPDREEPYNLLTQFYLYRKDYKAAITYAERSLQIRPDQPSQQLKLVRAVYLDNEFERALPLAETLAATYPGDINVQLFWGQLLNRFHDYSRAKVQWEKVMRLNPALPQAKLSWLRARYELGEYDDAIKDTKRYIGEQGLNEGALRILIEDALGRSDYNEAALWGEKLVAHAPGRAAFWLELANSYYHNTQPDKSRKTLERALVHHPYNPDILSMLALIELDDNHPNEAYRLCRTILEHYPNNRTAYMGEVRALAALQRREEALTLVAARPRDFWKDYEVELLQTASQFDIGNDRSAVELLERQIDAAKDAAYVPVLLYHGVSVNPRYGKSIYVGQLEDQFKALRDAGYTSITVRELSDMLDGKRGFPDKPILITFDDNRRDSFLLADPLLKKYNLKATMFVITASPIDGHPFYANWSMIRDYHASGRWDVQSHGHFAHYPIEIDGAGNTGSFLVNRQWLEEDKRAETLDEYAHRVDSDYVQSIDLLNRNVPDLNLVAYAFPYSEAGQQGAGNEPTAYDVNRDLLSRHFRFGFIQDDSGYNLVKPGAASPLLWRRFNVPRTMDGAQLLLHLSENQPYNLVRLMAARITYYQGRYETAGEMFEKLAADHAAPKQSTDYYLGAIAWYQERTRDAQGYFNTLSDWLPTASDYARNLAEKIKWENRPLLEFRGGAFRDVNKRANDWMDVRYQQSLVAPVDLWEDIGKTRYSQLGFGSLDTQHFDLGLSWRVSHGVGLAGEASLISSDRTADTVGGWLRADFAADSADTQIRAAHAVVDTLQAQLKRIQANTYSVQNIYRHTRNITSIVDLAWTDYDDGNSRADVDGTAYYGLTRLPELQLGLKASYSNARFASDFYYTPVDFSAAEFVARYQEILGTWSVEGKAGAGIALTGGRDSQGVYEATLELVKYFKGRFRGMVDASYYDMSTYRSWSVNGGVAYLF